MKQYSFGDARLLLKHQITKVKALSLTLTLFLLLAIAPYSYSQINGTNTNTPGSGYLIGMKGIRSIDNFYEEVYDVTAGINCPRSVLFRTYVNEADNYGIIAYQNNSAILNASYTVEIKEGTNTVSTVSTSWIGSAMLPISFSTPGKKTILYTPNSGSSPGVPSFSAQVIVIPKTYISVDVPEVCYDDLAVNMNDLHFNYNSTALYKDIAWPQPDEANSSAYYNPPTTGPGTCDQNKPEAGFGFTYPVDAAGQGRNFDVGGTDSIDSYSHWYKDNPINPTRWFNIANGGTKIFPSQSSLTDHFIRFADIDLNTSVTAPSPNPLTLDMEFNDGIQIQKLHAPVIVNRIFPNGDISATAYHDDTYTVSGDEVWKPSNNPVTNAYAGAAHSVYKINSELRVPAGATLAIHDMTIEFGPNGRLIVEASDGDLHAGALTLDHATLTALVTGCLADPKHWAGVELWGHSNMNQDVSWGYSGVFYQGNLTMINGSEISYAVNGIQNFNPADPNPAATTGGVIYAKESRFINNARAVNLAHFDLSYAPRYRADFTDCDFDINAPLTVTDNTYAHVYGVGVRGVTFFGCRFRHSAAYTGPVYKGISGVDFGANVDRTVKNGAAVLSSFTDVDGVRVINAGSMAYTVAVQNAQLSNMRAAGVYLGGTPAPRVRWCQFTMAPTLPYISSVFTPIRTGVVINTGSGYLVTDNTFTGTSAVNNAGALFASTGSDPNEVHSNVYNGLATGNLSNYLNRGYSTSGQASGLTFQCNGYNYNHFAEAARSTNTRYGVVDGMAQNQGSLSKAAENSFSGSSIDIYNPLTEVLPINYFSSSSTSSIISVGVTKIGGAGANKCDYSKDYTSTHTSGANGLFAAATERVSHWLSDSAGNRNMDSLMAAVNDWQSPYALLLKSDLLAEAGNSTEASTLYNSILNAYPGVTGDEATEFKYWGRRLMDVRMALAVAGKQMTELDNTQLRTIASVADSAQMWAKTRAQAWLTMYDGRTFDDQFLYPEDTASSQQRFAHIANAAAPGVYPNPVTDKLTVEFGDLQDATFKLQDILGKQVRSAAQKSSIMEVNVANLPVGVYVYKIWVGKRLQSQGKIIKR